MCVYFLYHSLYRYWKYVWLVVSLRAKHCANALLKVKKRLEHDVIRHIYTNRSLECIITTGYRCVCVGVSVWSISSKVGWGCGLVDYYRKSSSRAPKNVWKLLWRFRAVSGSNFILPKTCSRPVMGLEIVLRFRPTGENMACMDGGSFDVSADHPSHKAWQSDGVGDAFRDGSWFISINVFAMGMGSGVWECRSKIKQKRPIR